MPQTKKKIGKNAGVWEGVAVLNRVFTEGVSVQRHIGQRPRDVSKRALQIDLGRKSI